MSKKKTSTKKQWQLLVICLAVTLLSVVFGSGLRMTMAANWNPPTTGTTPPLGNTPGPVWLSPSMPQAGGFNLKENSYITDGATLLINGNNICLSHATSNAAINCPNGINSTLDDVAERGNITNEMISVSKLNIGYDLGGAPSYSPPNLALASDNLFFGVIDAGSTDGNLLLFQKGLGINEFKIDYNGNVWLAQNNEICFDVNGTPGDSLDDDCFSNTSGLGGDYISLKKSADIPADWGSPDDGGFWVKNTVRIGDPAPAELLTLPDGQNLIHGIISNTSDGNLLLLEEEGGPKFIIDIDSVSGMTAVRSSENNDLIIDAGDGGSPMTVRMYDNVDIPSGDLSVGGCFGPVFVGVSNARYPDDFGPIPVPPGGMANGGYENVNAACDATPGLEGSHVCTAQEMLNSLNCGWLWDNPGVYKPIIPVSDLEFYRFSHGAPALPTQTNDCVGWHSHAQTNDSAVWQFPSGPQDGGTGWALPCSTDLPFTFNYKFACCK